MPPLNMVKGSATPDSRARAYGCGGPTQWPARFLIFHVFFVAIFSNLVNRNLWNQARNLDLWNKKDSEICTVRPLSLAYQAFVG